MDDNSTVRGIIKISVKDPRERIIVYLLNKASWNRGNSAVSGKSICFPKIGTVSQPISLEVYMLP